MMWSLGNSKLGSFEVCAVEPPSYGEQRTKMLEDISIATGAKIFNNMCEKKLEEFELEDLGSCEKVIVSAQKTVILNMKGNKTLWEQNIIR